MISLPISPIRPSNFWKIESGSKIAIFPLIYAFPFSHNDKDSNFDWEYSHIHLQMGTSILNSGQ